MNHQKKLYFALWQQLCNKMNNLEKLEILSVIGAFIRTLSDFTVDALEKLES